jgi:hypothetical protein
MRRHFVKLLRFEELNRRKLTFSDATKIRLNPQTNQLELKADAAGKYPTDADLAVRGPLWHPEALTAWAGLHVDPLEAGQPAGASIGLRLNDGTTDRFWGGAAWDPAGAGNWSTEAEVAANIGSFPLTGRQLQLVVNLRTTDDKVTPTVEGVCVLIEADFDYLASIVGDSLVPSLRESFGDLVIDFALVVDSGGTNLSLLDLETPFNLVDVIEVYNHDTDPEHLVDIFSSFDLDGRQIEVSSAFDPGQTAWLKVKVAPEIMVNWSSQDYLEIEKIPAVVIDRVDVIGNHVFGTAHVRNVADSPRPTATVLKKPYRLRLELTVTLIGEKNRTLFALQDRALTHVTSTPLLRWRAVDEELTLTTGTEGEFRPRPDLRDEHSSSYSLRLHDVYLWLKPSEQANLIEQVNLDLARQT